MDANLDEINEFVFIIHRDFVV